MTTCRPGNRSRSRSICAWCFSRRVTTAPPIAGCGWMSWVGGFCIVTARRVWCSRIKWRWSRTGGAIHGFIATGSYDFFCMACKSSSWRLFSVFSFSCLEYMLDIISVNTTPVMNPQKPNTNDKKPIINSMTSALANFNKLYTALSQNVFCKWVISSKFDWWQSVICSIHSA